MTLKYLIDENVNSVYPQQLRRREPEIIIRVVGEPDTPKLGTLDPEILIWCEVMGFILVTNNRASMPVHLREHFSAVAELLGMRFGANVCYGIPATTPVKNLSQFSAKIYL